MTDKKITSNGVDVSKCNYFKAWYESRPNGFGGITVESYCYLYKDNCEKYPQCLYRSNQLQQLGTQLKRKEQECERYKRALDKIEKFTSGACDACKEFTPNEQNYLSCKYCQYKHILNIIDKAKEH